MSEDNYWTRLQRHSLSRRAMLRGAALGGAGLAGAALIGCGGDDDDDRGIAATGTPEVIEAGGLEGTGASQEVEAESAGEFDWIFEQPPKNVPIPGGTAVSTTSSGFDHFSPFHFGGASISDLIYDSLFTRYFRGEHQLLLWGIENVERPDELTNILTVRDGKFGPNPDIGERPVEAEDIFTSMRIMNEDITVWAPGLYYDGTDWDQSEVTDEKTITLVLSHPRNDFFVSSNLRFPSKEAGLMHLSGEKTLQEWDNPPGSGGYYQSSLTPGTKLEMTRNPGFSRSPWPYIENRKIINITDQAAVQAQFRAGETLSFTPTGSNKILFDEILGDLGSGDRPRVYGVKVPSRSNGVTFGMSSALREPFNDVRMREAVTRAIDRERASDIITGGESTKTGPGITSFFTDWHLPMDDPQLVDWLRFDPQRSRDLIEAMRADGVDVDRELLWLFKSESQFEGDVAVIGMQMLKEVGFNVRGEAYPSTEYATRVLRRATADHDFTGVGAGPPVPSQQLRILHSQSNYIAEAFCLCDPEHDAMIDDWEQTTDPEEIASKSIAIQRWLIERWPPVYYWYLNFTRRLYKITYRNINPAEGSGGLYSWVDESYWPG